MIWHSPKRAVTALLSQYLLRTTVVVGLAVVTPPTLVLAAQPVAKTVQTEGARAKAEELLKQARKEADRGQFAAARELLEKARTADPKVPGLDQLAKDIAAKQTQAAAGNRKSQVDDLLKSAKTFQKSDKYDEALTQVSKVLALDPTNSEAKKLQNDIKEEQIASRSEKLGTVVKTRIKSADVAVKENNFEQARRNEASAREAAGGLFKEDLDALAGRISKAESAFNAKKNKDEISRLLKTAETQTKANQFDSARQSLSKIFQLDRQNKKANAMLAKVGEKEKDFLSERAERELKDQVAAADQYMKAKKYNEAVAAYEGLVAKNPTDAKLKSKLTEARKEAAEASGAAVAKKADDAKKAAGTAVKSTSDSETKRLADAKKAEEARRAEAIKKEAAAEKAREADAKKADAEKKVAEAKKAADEKRAAEEKKLADAKKEVEAKKDAEEKKVAEAKKAADEKRAAEEKKLADAKKEVEAKKDAEEKKIAEAKKAADEKRAAEEKKLADAKKEVEAKKDAEEKKLSDTKKDLTDKKAAEEKELADAKKKLDEEERLRVAAAEREAEARKAAEVKATATPAAEDTAPFRTPVPSVSTNDLPFVEPVAETPVAPTPTPAPTKTPVAVVGRQSPAAPTEAGKTPVSPTKAAAKTSPAAVAESKNREAAEKAYDEGVKLYGQKKLAEARQRWLDAKELDPTFTKADTYLQNTEAEFNAMLANQAQKADFAQREADAVEKMNTLIPLRTLEPTNLSDFLQSLRLLSGIDFVIAGEVSAKVEAAFEDEPLTQVLDTVLLPIGLRWDRKPGSSTVVITPDLRTEVFTVLPDQLNTIDLLIKDNVVARLLYGPAGKPTLAGQEIYTDDRKNIVVMTDSESNLQKFRRFLDNLKGTTGTQLIFDSYQVDESKAAEIKAMIGAILSADDKSAFNPERKLILEGDTLIIKDTPENVAKVRKLLQDENFLKKFYSNQISMSTFNLTPVVSFGEDNPDLVRTFTDQVVQVVDTYLYAHEGRQKAESEGRRRWYDPATLQLTITDYPDRLQAVQDFIESLPQIQSRKRNKIYFLDWANAGDLVSQIESFLGINSEAGNTETATGTTITKNLRVEDELNFNGAFFRVTRVNENQVNDDNDDSVELVVRTGTTSQDVTIEEFRSEFVEDFEIVAEDIKPSNTPGEGRARLTVTYNPNGQGGGGVAGEGGGGAAQGTANNTPPARETADDTAQTGLSLVEIENLNAIYVEYDNAEELRRVEFWLKTLDIPTLQVSIEVKFVEVITNKAKELKPDFSIADLSEGITLSDSVLRSRFAQDRDEFDTVFDPAIEGADSANLLKGATVFNYIVSNGNSPISFTLRALEATGVINVVNGPTVTVLNTESADFRIERQFGLRQPVQGSTGGGGNDQNNFTAVASLVPVDMSVTPNVTRAGNITLDIDVEMNDFDQNLGQATTLAAATGTTATSITPDATLTQRSLGVIRKELTTQARIKDGGTVVLGGWRSDRSYEGSSGIPVLRDIPFVGKYFFDRTQSTSDKITLLIFLTGSVVKD
ncbi:hypothetical protein IT570_11200 [Candidatus Sumerlaeota bacterium]|nr:hypothetical protein [Candidatus Sumerlaeota bacterium]